MKCMVCSKRIPKGKPYTPVHEEDDELFPIGYVCDPCAPSFRAEMQALRRGHLTVVK